MKIIIEAHRIDVKGNELTVVSQKEVGAKLAEADAKECTASEALAAVKAEVPVDAKTLEPVKVKYYRHICDHGNPAGGCRLVEIV